MGVCVRVRACVAFRIGFYSIFADSRLSAHAGLDLHLSFSSVRGLGGGGDGGGVIGGGDDVHAHATFVFCFLYSPCSGLFWRGTLVGRGGGWGGPDDVHANATFVFCFLCSPCSGLFWCGTLVGRGGVGRGECTDDDASDVADAAIVFMTK